MFVNDWVGHYCIAKDNPEHYLYYHGLKFCRLNVHNMKIKRGGKQRYKMRFYLYEQI